MSPYLWVNILSITMLTYLFFLFPSGKNRQKTVWGWGSAFFVNLALKIQCHAVKIHSYRLPFQRFCPLGYIKLL